MTDFSSLLESFHGTLLMEESDRLAYCFDAAPAPQLNAYASLTGASEARSEGVPDAVAVVNSAEEVRQLVSWCVRHKVPYVARGAGTNLCGGCIPLKGGIVISLARLTRILSIDTEARVAVVEPGVVNMNLQKALEPLGFFYAPDPGSHKVCTLGGNVAENAGGPRCLRYGVTTDHVRKVEAVMPDGELDSFSPADAGLDIMSLLVGSEGTLGIVTKIWLDVIPAPESLATALVAFPSLDDAVACVSEIIAAGILPRALEAMDRVTLETIEAAYACGYPRAEALLLIELEGAPRDLERELGKIKKICVDRGASEFRLAADDAERAKLWEGRRGAYAALSRKAPSILVEDGVVPRNKLPEAARRVREIGAAHGLEPAMLFHAGDGNLHPNIYYDDRDPELSERVHKAGTEMMKAFVELGGSISGEHGIGVEKRAAMSWLFPPETLRLFAAVKRAFDPENLANPDKVVPLPDEEARREFSRPVSPPSDRARSLIERVKELAAEKKPVFLIGTGTKSPEELRAPAPGSKAAAREILTTRPLASIIDFDQGNYTVTVEAGISPRELKAKLEPEGYFVPIPLVPGTVGGLLGAKSWPGVRKGILGMRVILPNGSVAELGGKTVKNVAGYDVPRMLIGSWGTLAIILEVTFKLSPIRLDIPNDLPAPERPSSFGRWHRRLKDILDPGNRLNRWEGIGG